MWVDPLTTFGKTQIQKSTSYTTKENRFIYVSCEMKGTEGDVKRAK